MRSATLAVVVLLVSAGCLSGLQEAGPQSDPEAEPRPNASVTGTAASGSDGGVRVTVTEVIDGDTVTVAYANGTRETVRLLGVDTPEVYGDNDPGEFEGVPDTDRGARCLDRAGENASAYAKARLSNESVTLVFDERSDRRGYYGRLLAYVRVDGESFNRALLREGHARVYPSTFTERERYERTEATAREARRGLWSCVDVGGGEVGDGGVGGGGEGGDSDESSAAGGDSETATPTAYADGGGPLAVVEIEADAPGNDHENPDGEYVVLRNVGEDPLDLSGWTVEDEADHAYRFPDGTTLAPGANLTLRTGSGRDADSTVYWGSDGAVWNNDGDVVTVRDESGSVVVRRAY